MPRITLTQGKSVIVDKVNVDKLLKIGKWLALFNGFKWYAIRRVKNKKGKWDHLYMHRFLTGAPKGKEVDHKNGNGLDNRISNLRVCSPSENQHNRGRQKNNKSGFKGVSFNKERNKFQVFIALNSKHIYIGQFNSAEEGASAYAIAAKKYHGKFAKLR